MISHDGYKGEVQSEYDVLLSSISNKSIGARNAKILVVGFDESILILVFIIWDSNKSNNLVFVSFDLHQVNNKASLIPWLSLRNTSEII